MTSPARIAANQANSKKSTGPRSVEGKSRASLNSLKHGMRAETLVLPTESPQEFEAHVELWMDDWRPPTETRRFLVERAAISAWRCNRCVRDETARISQRAHQALKAWDEERAVMVDGLMATFMQKPDESLTSLLEIPEGVVRLLDICARLSDDLTDHTSWLDPEEHHGLFIRMFGLPEAAGDPQNYADDPEGLGRFGPDSMTKQEAMMLVRSSEALLMHNRPDLAETPAQRRELHNIEGLAAQLRVILHGRMRAMQMTLAEIDDRSTTRIKSAETFSLRPQKEDALSQRYEAHHEREVRANLGLLMKLEKTGDDLVGLSHAEERRIAESQPTPAESAQLPNEAKPSEPAVAKVPNEPKASEPAAAKVPNEAKAALPYRAVVDQNGVNVGVVGESFGAEMPRSVS